MKYDENKEYFLGLDIGTNSVGYAVTDNKYKINKFNGKAMWGAHIFDESLTAEERRAFRSARRRLQRKRQRVELLRELFAVEIAKKDEFFYKRLDESFLYREDKDENIKDMFSLFNDDNFTDKTYHDKYPTIHHLIMDIINNKEAHDVRLVYLAISYILTHRGHFLFDVDGDSIDKILEFDSVFNNLKQCCDILPWEIIDQKDMENALRKEFGIKKIQENLKTVIFSSSKPNKQQTELIKAVSGGQFMLSTLFQNEQYAQTEFNKLSFAKSDIDSTLEGAAHELGDDCETVYALQAVYNWCLTINIMKDADGKYISNSKIKVYEAHKEDLKLLKYLIKKYKDCKKYDEVFRVVDDKLKNYVAYSQNVTSVAKCKRGKLKRATYEEFLDYIKSVINTIEPDLQDKEIYERTVQKIAANEFMPKQKTTDNRVIPSQLYYYELKSILENAKEYLPFLNSVDDSNLSVSDKILSIFEFRIPYYVGPLNKYHGKFAWLERKQGKIYPWNFDKMVDLEKSEEAFIRRMTAKCTYIRGEDVLPKNSLLYSKYMVLNEINKIKADGYPISAELKQRLYNELFVKQNKNVTKKSIIAFLKTIGVECNDISGIDDRVKSSLKSYHKFKRMINSGILTESDVEQIINRATVTTDKKRFKLWLKNTFSNIENNDILYITNMNFTDYGRLSYKLLSGIQAPNPETGEMLTIIQMMWETNYNLMELLSENFLFAKEIETLNNEYYSQYPQTLNGIMDDMYVSPSAKRSIYRTLDIVKEIIHIKGKAPSKIFVEMARAKQDDPQRTVSRKNALLEKYKALDKAQYSDIIERLNGETDERLKSKKLFLYYSQLGRCMYTGKSIDYSLLNDSNRYDIDHIFPRAKVKDDSFNNMVLVEKEANGLKKDIYPIDKQIQDKMSGFWSALRGKNMISDEKYYRLTRTWGFKDEEIAGFINRQLVETRQSIKALTVILKHYCKDIVYVKAELASNFRHTFELEKSRAVNDLHHAKDAYLNIVMGNIYDVKFTRNPLNFAKQNHDKYTLKLTAKNNQGLLSHDIERAGVCAWKADGTYLKTVLSTMGKNNINYVRYAYSRNGGFYNQTINKAPHGDNSLINIKNKLDTAKYGGFNNTTATYFTMITHTDKGKKAISVKPVDLLVRKKFESDDVWACKWLEERYNLENVNFVPGRKIMKINTLIEIDGFRANIASKSSEGKTLVLASASSLILNLKWERYIKRIENLTDKAKRSRKPLIVSSEYDKITAAENTELYNILLSKCGAGIYSGQSFVKNIAKTLESGKETFEKLTLEEQIQTILNIVNVFKTGRTTGCDLRKVNGKGQSGTIKINAMISKLNFDNFYVIDQSPTGLFEKKSQNIMQL